MTNTIPTLSLSFERTLSERIFLWLHGRRRVTPHNANALAKYVAVYCGLLHLNPRVPDAGRTALHPWTGFGAGWRFKDVPMFIRAEHIVPAESVRAVIVTAPDATYPTAVLEFIHANA